VNVTTFLFHNFQTLAKNTKGVKHFLYAFNSEILTAPVNLFLAKFGFPA